MLERDKEISMVELTNSKGFEEEKTHTCECCGTLISKDDYDSFECNCYNCYYIG